MLTNPIDAISALPSGRYSVAVSGGADSTALARLLAANSRHTLVFAHLNHELRAAESDGDEAFVRSLAQRLDRPIVISRISAELSFAGMLKNDSARYRAARLHFFQRVVIEHSLDGVLLAHHADDQAETVLLRIVRGANLVSLGGMAQSRKINGLPVLRPLLGVRRGALRDYLKSIGQSWREDASNDSSAYRRNVIRKLLAVDPALFAPLIALAGGAGRWRAALEAAAPHLPATFACNALGLPTPVACFAAARWLLERGAPSDEISPATRRRLVDQATNASSPARNSYPGGILVRRRKNWVSVIDAPPIRRAGLQSQEPHGKDQAAAAGEF